MAVYKLYCVLLLFAVAKLFGDAQMWLFFSMSPTSPALDRAEICAVVDTDRGEDEKLRQHILHMYRG